MILCAGEALIDMIPNADGEYVPHVGGSVLNTAAALGRLGEDVALITGLSSDPFGALIEERMTSSHVATTHAVRSARNTTLAFVHLDQGDATYTFYDDETATRTIQPSDIPPVPDNAQAMFFGCISLCNPPVADTLLHLAMSQPADRLIMLDVNVRPGFAVDETTYRARLSRLMSRANIVKLSTDDIAWLIPEGDLEAKARAAQDMTPGMLLLTEGGAGATAIMPDNRSVRVAAQSVEVVDTVGAGDTFNAGCLAALRRADALSPAAIDTLDEATITDMLTLATRAAAITVSRAGANPPWANELD
ncbi:MAG: carbohydrate kinase [Pseudomonadota bacterium]